MTKRQRIILRLISILVFLLGAYYTLFIQTQKYESNSVISVKDLSKNQSISALGAMFLPNGPGPSQDSSVLQIYISSQDMYNYLDKDFNLTNYYTSKKIDFLHRLYKDTNITLAKATKENLVKVYNSDLFTFYEPKSATLSISYKHADPKVAKKVVESILNKSKEVLNKYEQENAKVVLSFLEKQEARYKKSFMNAIKKLIMYQNRNKTFDPKVDIEAKSALLASLESELIKTEIEYNGKVSKFSKKSSQVKPLIDALRTLKAKIAKIKKEITGSSKKRLNRKVVDYSLIQNEVDFAKEMYKQILLKVEETKLSVNKSAKNIIVITKPTLPENYSEPNKVKQILTIFIVIALLYNIFRFIFLIIKDHID